MPGGDGLAKVAGVKRVYRLIGQAVQTLVTLVIDPLCSLLDGLNLDRFSGDSNLDATEDIPKLVMQTGVQDFTKMTEAKTVLNGPSACSQCDNGTLSPMIDTVNIVQDGFDLSFQN